MEDGGFSLFNFVAKLHKFIKAGKLDIAELHRIAKIILKQMIEAIDFIHSKNIAHMDISLENWLINDLDINIDRNGKIHFCDQIQIKLCDFGLSLIFEYGTKWECNKWCGKTGYFSPEIASRKKNFDAKSNDIFCLGVCLFMVCSVFLLSPSMFPFNYILFVHILQIIIGSAPWSTSASMNDPAFQCIVDGNLEYLLKGWNRSSFVNQEMIELFNSFFKYEQERVTLSELKRNKWLYSSN